MEVLKSEHDLDYDGALKIQKENKKDDNWRRAVEYVLDHRDQLTHNVYIILPSDEGQWGTENPIWDKIKSGSESRCGCGAERVIMPLNPRTTFESSGKKVVVSTTTIYIRPIGGDKESCVLSVEIIADKNYFHWLHEPLAPMVISIDMFSKKRVYLDKLKEAMKKSEEKPVFMAGYKSNPEIPIFSITEVDLDNKTVEIELDALMEIFDPDKEVDRHSN